MKIHSESLMNIPLVRQMMEDPTIRFVERRLDQSWVYNGAFPMSLSGFNPGEGVIFYPQISQFARWRRHPERSARELNLKDRLVREVLFATHDYLHVWAYRAIQEIHPKLGFGIRPITEKNIEDFTFCHLVTEAAATVGLDYWQLSLKNVNGFCPIGSAKGPLTVSYRESDAHEYRRFHPGLEVQSPKFFEFLSEFYCTGTFQGFGLDDFRRSPLLANWLEHELSYGESQRKFTRTWLSHLAGLPNFYPPAQGQAPLPLDARWKKSLVRELAKMLWEKVKSDKICALPAPAKGRTHWQSPRAGSPDFRFLNINRLSEDEIDRLAARLEDFPRSVVNFRYLFYQMIGRLDYESFDPELRKLFGGILEKRELGPVRALISRAKTLKPSPAELRDVMFLN